jgi:hypothetical protein
VKRISRVRRPFVAGMLASSALAMWLSTGATGSAALNASATQTQGLAAAVPAAISWGSTGTCSQSMGTANFAETPPGSSVASSTFTGCVTSNKKWSVAAVQSAPLVSDNDGSTIPASNLVIQTVNPGSGSTVVCGASNTTCTLDAAQNLFTLADKTAQQFDYRYVLTIPAGATGGTYSGGQVTFTASN